MTVSLMKGPIDTIRYTYRLYCTRYRYALCAGLVNGIGRAKALALQKSTMVDFF
jgi:hypothetical protein